MGPRGLLPLLLACAVRSAAGGYLLPTDGSLIASNTTQAGILIRNASHVQVFSQLIMHFTTQVRRGGSGRPGAWKLQG